MVGGVEAPWRGSSECTKYVVEQPPKEEKQRERQGV